MTNRPKRSPKSDTTPAALLSGQARAHQIIDQRRRDMATRSTLSRLRNRKSDLK